MFTSVILSDLFIHLALQITFLVVLLNEHLNSVLFTTWKMAYHVRSLEARLQVFRAS